MSKPTLEVERYNGDLDPIVSCAVCGDDIETGDEMVWEPAPEISPRAHVIAHPHCSVRNGYRLNYVEEP